MHVCIFEDTQFKNFLPLVYSRPVFDLRCGALSLREKIGAALPRTKFILYVRSELVDCVREELPEASVNIFPDGDLWLVNGRVLADEHLSKLVRRHASGSKVFFSGEEVVAAFIDRSDRQHIIDQLDGRPVDTAMVGHLPSAPFECSLVHYPWDMVHHTPEEIGKDVRRSHGLKKKTKATVVTGAHLINKKNIHLGSGTAIRPGAVLDAENGAVIIGKNVMVMPNSFIEGPAYIGDNSVIKAGAKIYHGTSIGKRCKVGGEVDAAIIQSYSNKQHDGFLGHSYVGSWVNIGADTNTSDLKNTYGSVKVPVNGELVDTNMQFVGLTMGDHSKTGINVMFDTGTNVGVFCNVFGSGLPPKFLPSFSWGRDNTYATYQLEKSLETARRVMARRDIQMSEAYERLLRNIFSATIEERRKAGIQS